MPESAAFSTVQKHIYTCVCICMYVYTYIYIYMCVYMHVCIYIYIHIHVSYMPKSATSSRLQKHIYTCMRICIYVYKYIYIYMSHSCPSQLHLPCCKNISIHVCVYVCIYIYIYTYLTHAQVSCILHVANELHQNKHRQKKFCIPPKESFATDPYIPSKEPYIPSKEPNILHQRDVSFAKKSSVESALNNSKHCSKQLFPLLKNPTLKAP